MARRTHVPPPRHARRSRASRGRRAFAIVMISLGVLALSAGGVAAYMVWDLNRTLGEEAFAEPEGVVVPPDIGEHEGGFDLLLVGSDLCEPEYAHLFPTRCDDGESEGERNDVTMLVHISDAPRRATIVSFPRDMIVPIPSCPSEDGEGSYSAMAAQPLNATMHYGGVPCTWLTIQGLVDIPIQYAAKITWGGVIEMSEAIGGVDVCIGGNGVHDPDSGFSRGPGRHTLHGAEALAFLRVRYAIGDGSDLGRISNQQQFLTSLVRKVRNDGVLSDPAALLRLAFAAAKAITPSDQLRQPTTMVQLALALKDIPFEDIVFVQYPTFYDELDPAKVVPDRASADALFAAILANEPLTITGAASGGDGVEIVEPAAPATPDPSASAAPPRVALPDNVPGTNAAQVTCTVGRG